MGKMTGLDSELVKARAAREEFIANYCNHWPATYKALMPLTDEGKLLLAWKNQIEAAIASDFEKFVFERDHNPWASGDPKSYFIDWTGVDGLMAEALGQAGCEVAPGVAVKFGEGIDPADGQRKPFQEFVEVIAARDAALARPEVAKLVALRKEHRELTDKLTVGQNQEVMSLEAADAVRSRRDEIRRELKKLEGGK